MELRPEPLPVQPPCLFSSCEQAQSREQNVLQQSRICRLFFVDPSYDLTQYRKCHWTVKYSRSCEQAKKFVEFEEQRKDVVFDNYKAKRRDLWSCHAQRK